MVDLKTMYNANVALSKIKAQAELIARKTREDVGAVYKRLKIEAFEKAPRSLTSGRGQ